MIEKHLKPKLAIMDMNNGVPNQGLRCIIELVRSFADLLEWEVFDVRAKNEIPDKHFDIYISSGGPGSPLEPGSWRKGYFELIDDLWAFNQGHQEEKKHVFFICYSFQIICAHFKLSQITRRKSTSFGVFPIHKTKAGLLDPILSQLADPYYAVDSRDWQVVQPKLKVFEEHGAKILSIEKIRTHVEYERAIMMVRFSDQFIGTQFHPEAEAEGMKGHFNLAKNKQTIINNFSAKKYDSMMLSLDDPEKIAYTHSVIIPTFITIALESIQQNVMA